MAKKTESTASTPENSQQNNKKLILILSVVVGVLLIVGGIVLFVVFDNQPANDETAPENTELTSGGVPSPLEDSTAEISEIDVPNPDEPEIQAPGQSEE